MCLVLPQLWVVMAFTLVSHSSRLDIIMTVRTAKAVFQALEVALASFLVNSWRRNIYIFAYMSASMLI